MTFIDQQFGSPQQPYDPTLQLVDGDLLESVVLSNPDHITKPTSTWLSTVLLVILVTYLPFDFSFNFNPRENVHGSFQHNALDLVAQL